MSRCKEIQAVLHEASLLDEALPQQLEAHLARCPSCSALLEDLRAMAASMRSLDPPELPDGFELSLRRRLVAAAAEKEQLVAEERSKLAARRRVAPLWIAAAATILIVAGGLFVWHRHSAPPASAVTPSYHRLNLSIRSRLHHDHALFEVQLPADVALDPSLRALATADSSTIRWHSTLEPGLNAIDLPLVNRQAAGKIVARVTVAGQTTTSTVQISPATAAHAERGATGIQLALVLAEPGRVVR